MIYLELFLSFLKIGAASFGGGYGMISIIREEALYNGWLTEEQLINFIAVSESTPGPIAVNMATFIGSSQGGIAGALIATLGVVAPSFIIILIIAAVLKNILKYAGVKAVLGGIRPAIVGLISASALIMFLSSVFGIKTADSNFSFDWKGLIILTVVTLISLAYRFIRKKTFSPILLIIISGILGILLYYVPLFVP